MGSLRRWAVSNVDTAWNRGMKIIAFLALAAAFSSAASSHEHVPGHLSYEARKAHDQAKYQARKAHDLAKLQSKIYGIGHGLYGFRYGSHYPYSSEPFPLLPFIDKYPLFDFGISPYPFSHYFPYNFDPYFSPSSLDFPSSFSDISSPLHGPHDLSNRKPYFRSGISGHLTGFGYPNGHRNSYSKSYSYGSGYSYGNKDSYEKISKPYAYSYSGLDGPLNSGYVKSLPGQTLVYQSGDRPKSHGYQYAYVKESPEYSEIHPHHVGGYNSIYGTRVASPGYGQPYKESPDKIVAYQSKGPAHSGHYLDQTYQDSPGKIVVFQSKEPTHSGHYHGQMYQDSPDKIVVYQSKEPALSEHYHGQAYQDSPGKILTYESQRPAHFGQFHLEPVGKILTTGEHGGHSYIPESVSNFDVDDPIDNYSIEESPLHTDLAAFGSEKSEVQETKKSE